MSQKPQLLPSRARTRKLEHYSVAPLETQRGLFQVHVFRELRTGAEHVAMVRGVVAGMEGVPTRVHSECFTSEIVGSVRCDCRAQLDRALDFIARGERGVLLYLRQEGRGIGLGNKIKAYELQQRLGLDTVEANRHLGFPDDLRRYDVAAEMLGVLGVLSVDLMTNNPLKIAGLVNEGMPVRRRLESRTEVGPMAESYLRVKKEKSGHLVEWLPETEQSSGKVAS